MESPRGQVDVQAGTDEFVAVPDEDPAVDQVGQPPLPASGRRPRQRKASLGTVVGQVHRDDMMRYLVVPGPGQHVVVSGVVWPAATVEHGPVATPRARGGEKKLAVEQPQTVVDRLVGAPGQEHRELLPPPLELPVVPERGPGNRGYCDGRGAIPAITERAGG